MMGLVMTHLAEPAASTVTEASFGEYEGETVKLYALTNENGLILKAIPYGALITEFHVPDAKGNVADVVQGFDELQTYVDKSPYFGATIGRVAGRIKGAEFELFGKRYKLKNNDGPNAHHGGKKGWDKVLWQAEAKDTADGPQVVFTRTSPDGEEGYPGTVQAAVTYTLTHQNELKVEMRATTDKTTLINMIHHTYWNLGGHDSGTILDHELTLMAESYTPAVVLVPDGQVKPVQGTPLDFRTPKLIGKDFKAEAEKLAGYDHNWVVNGPPRELRPVARLKHPATGRVMTLSANQPGVQFYSSNFLDGTLKGKGGVSYPRYSSLCLESQKFPNSVNIPAWREEVILEPGQVYLHTMVHRFTTE